MARGAWADVGETMAPEQKRRYKSRPLKPVSKLSRWSLLKRYRAVQWSNRVLVKSLEDLQARSGKDLPLDDVNAVASVEAPQVGELRSALSACQRDYIRVSRDLTQERNSVKLLRQRIYELERTATGLRAEAQGNRVLVQQYQDLWRNQTRHSESLQKMVDALSRMCEVTAAVGQCIVEVSQLGQEIERTRLAVVAGEANMVRPPHESRKDPPPPGNVLPVPKDL